MIRRITLFVAVLALVAPAAGCFSFRWVAVAPTAAPVGGRAEELEVDAAWVAPPGKVSLTNGSSHPRSFSPRLSTVQAGTRTFAVATAFEVARTETSSARRVVTRDPVTLAPWATQTMNLYPADGVFPAGAPLHWRLSISDAEGGPATMLPLEVSPPAERVYVTRAGTADRVMCYVTGLFYGGWCWFIRPGEDDLGLVTEKARAELGDRVEVKYLDRR